MNVNERDGSGNICGQNLVENFSVVYFLVDDTEESRSGNLFINSLYNIQLFMKNLSKADPVNYRNVMIPNIGRLYSIVLRNLVENKSFYGIQYSFSHCSRKRAYGNRKLIWPFWICR